MREMKVLVGFASELRDADTDIKLAPIYKPPNTEMAFVTMPIPKELLDDPEERKDLAEFIAEAVADKIRELIEQGPQVGAIL